MLTFEVSLIALFPKMNERCIRNHMVVSKYKLLPKMKYILKNMYDLEINMHYLQKQTDNTSQSVLSLTINITFSR